MGRFSYYIDWGAGFVGVNPYNNKLNLQIVRGELNDFIQRKQLTGNFSLIEDEFDTAILYFVTNGNYKAPVKIYEHGTDITGNLKYEGWARRKPFIDYGAKVITIDSFETDDIYSPVIPFLETGVVGETLVEQGGYIAVDDFTAQGIDSNCNKIQGYAWSGTAWAPTGNAFTLNTIGRVAVCAVGGSIVMFDNSTLELRMYAYTAPNWALAATGTSLFMNILTGNGAVCSYTSTQVAFIDDFFHEIRIYTLAAGTWTLSFSNVIQSIKFPSLAFVATGFIAMADEGTQELIMISGINPTGTPFGLGNVKKPSICTLNSGSNRIALIDGETNTLRAMVYTAGIWTQVGSNIYIGGLNEPTVSFESTDVVNVYDSYYGSLQKYTFSGTAWSATGNSTAITGGYSAGLGLEVSGVLAVIKSDSYKYESRRTFAFKQLINSINFAHGLYTLNYIMKDTGTGATFDYDEIHVGSLKTVREAYEYDTSNDNLYEFKLIELFKLAEIFQNYWYIELDTGENMIKFTQPDLFSSFGTDIVLSTYDAAIAIAKNQRTYTDKSLIEKEQITFDNEFNPDFKGLDIVYNRNTPVVEKMAAKYTTDFQYIQDNFLKIKDGLTSSGLFVIYAEEVSSIWVVTGGAGILGGASVKNYLMSKSQIQNDFWKDYRYSDDGNIDINGTPSAVQDTCRNMVEFPDVELNLPDFPDDIGSVDWGGGTKSFIMILSMSLDSYITTIKSRLLDL